MANGHDPNKPPPTPAPGTGTGTGTGKGTGTGTGGVKPAGNDRPPQT
jgi:hypothetical protein